MEHFAARLSPPLPGCASSGGERGVSVLGWGLALGGGGLLWAAILSVLF